MWRGLQGGINFYWRILVIMDPYYPPYELALNARSGSFPLSMYGPRVAAAGEELRAMENRRAGMVPPAPRKRNGTRSRLPVGYATAIDARYGNLPYNRISNDPYAWANGPPILRGTVAGTPERGFNPNGPYSGDVVRFSGFGGRSRTRRRRTTKKRTRKHRG